MLRLLAFPFSPTRALAAFLIDRKIIHNFSGLMIWNFIFYSQVFISTALIIWHVASTDYVIKLAFVIIFDISASRINELVFAFYGEVLKKVSGKSTNRLCIGPERRIILLSLAYVELIFHFAILFCLVQHWLGIDSFKSASFDYFEALYLSGLTITTTGYGDIVPVHRLARLLTVYEAVSGIVFIAAALGMYIGLKDTDHDNKAKCPGDPSGI